jgi:stringent starvation protein B
LKLGNDFIEFKARFGGKPREIMVPIHRVMAIYARENGQGMAFPVSDEESVPAALSAVDSPALESMDTEDKPETPSPSNPGRPALKRIK